MPCAPSPGSVGRNAACLGFDLVGCADELVNWLLVWWPCIAVCRVMNEKNKLPPIRPCLVEMLFHLFFELYAL
jgi:hypothetical protein